MIKVIYKQIIAKRILKSLHKKGISRIYLERVFELNIGELKGWLSHEVIALLKCINCYPWLITIAEYKFGDKP